MAEFFLSVTDNDDANRLDCSFDFFTMPGETFPDYYYTTTIFGMGGNDTLGTFLGSMSVTLHGGDGDDEITGGSGADILNGDNFDAETLAISGIGNDTINGGDGGDEIYGAGGNDRLFGEEGEDVILAGIGKDRVDGGDGADTIQSGKGNDVMSGGLGADTFIILKGDGRDVIRDFTARGLEHDVIDLDDMRAVADFRDLIKNHADQDGKDVVLSLGNGTTLTLEGVKIKQLISDDFAF